ncbi:ATP-binding protein [Thiocystis violacea]|uniref:ATP-binding protein n=1 Tax=Thiocystis violacea TaxID=13725 RepID=UPI0019089AF2|nr:ATP-binding protein [Thiocystis violacea]MBK1720256.1 hypothetical protein [Thiocystis violacea]
MSSPRLRLDFVNRSDDLDAALDRLESFMESEHAGPKLTHAARLVLEELLTNTLKYGYDDSDAHPLRVDFGLGPPATLRIEDDGHPFDPTARAPAPVLDAAVEDRPIGGLGLHLVRSLTASLRYARHDGLNRLDVVFLE